MSSNELQNLAEACQRIGQVVLASVFVDPIASGNFSIKGLAIGLLLLISFFSASFLFAKKLDSKL